MNAALTPFLAPDAGVPLDRPFTTSWARAQGVDSRRLRAWRQAGLLLSPVHGVWYAAQLADDLALRLACLRLVVPEHAVVTDRTAAWLHGAERVLRPNAHLAVPPVDLFLLPGGRLRRDVTRSGQRDLLTDEIELIDGIRVTTKLRTTCDLGRHLPRRQAFAAMCAMLQVADFVVEDLQRQAEIRFRGHRWVRQLRGLIPLCDPRFASPGECALALIWHDTPGLPPFEPQVPAPAPHGFFYLDLGVPDLLYGAEYDGAEFHGADRAAADAARRTWLTEQAGWMLSVFVAEDVRGTGRCASERLQRDIAEARRNFGVRSRRVVL